MTGFYMIKALAQVFTTSAQIVPQTSSNIAPKIQMSQGESGQCY